MSTTFGKKTSAAPAAFGKRKAAIAPVSRPVQSGLSPEAMSFLSAQRAQPDAAPASSYAAPANAGISGGKPVFWRRIVAKLIDEVAMWLLVILMSGGAAARLMGTYIDAPSGSAAEDAAAVGLMGYVLLFMVFGLVYSVAMQVSPLQATLGKMAVGVIVTDKHGDRPGFGRILLRETVGRTIANFMPFYSGYMMGVFNKQRRCIQDHIGGTMVCTREAQAASYVEAFA